MIVSPEAGKVMPGSRLLLSQIQETWAEMLGLSAFGPHDDFFELGGHSLMAASTVARRGKRLGVDLPGYALFAAPTPSEMAELIAEMAREDTGHGMDGTTQFLPDWVVPLQREGAGRPVFVFSAGHNEAVALGIEARVVDHTGRDHPVWRFRQDDPMLDQARADGVPGMTAAFMAQMRDSGA